MELPFDRRLAAQRGRRLEYFTIAWNSVEGLVAVIAGALAGSISLVLVAPGHQRRGIGADLLSAGLARLHTAGASVAHAGSGGTDYFWNP